MTKNVKISDIEAGPIVHPVLSGSFIERIKMFKRILGDVDDISLERSIDAFKRDANPEKELAVWERIASTFQTYLLRNPTSDPTVRKDIFAVLCLASTGAKEYPNVRHLSDQQIKHLVLNYRGL